MEVPMVKDNLDQRLQVALALRDRLSQEAQRIAGRKEAAEKTLEKVEAEIRGRKLDPATLDQTLSTLETAYAQEVSSFEEAVKKAQKALSPYMEIL
jgi:predicted  nucleic acid-binding Zn-ribbon protein